MLRNIFFACTVVVVGCGGAGKNSGQPLAGERKVVDETSCNAWGDKFDALMKAAVHDDLNACLAKETNDAKSPEVQKTRKLLERRIAKDIDDERGEVVRGCMSQAGKEYFTSDADCYMNAGKLKDWANCNFGTPFFQDFAELGATFDKQAVKSCEEGIEEGKKEEKKGHSEDDDDD